MLRSDLQWLHKHTPGVRPTDLNVLNITQVETFVQHSPQACITLLKKTIRHESMSNFIVKVDPLISQRLSVSSLKKLSSIRNLLTLTHTLSHALIAVNIMIHNVLSPATKSRTITDALKPGNSPSMQTVLPAIALFGQEPDSSIIVHTRPYKETVSASLNSTAFRYHKQIQVH